MGNGSSTLRTTRRSIACRRMEVRQLKSWAVPGVSGADLVAVSPDGHQLAFTYQEGSPIPLNKLSVVSASGGTPLFVCQLPIGADGLHWSPSGKALQYRLTRNGSSNIWEQPLAGGAPRQ